MYLAIFDFRLPGLPTTSLIYPQATRAESLSTLLDANESRPFHKGLPIDIILLINDELHSPNPVYEKIRSIWTTDASFERDDYDHIEVSFNASTKTFYIPERPLVERSYDTQHRFHYTISSADLLYRMRCLFPEIPVKSVRRYTAHWTWTVAIRYIQSDINIEFSECGCGGLIFTTDDRLHNLENDYSGRATPLVPQSEEEVNNAFTTDAIQLLNMLFGTIDGKRFIYYHPAADADHPITGEYIIKGLPRTTWEDEEENWMPYHRWCPDRISSSDLSSFKSLLPNLKYNIESRKVDPVNGTVCLTTVISSSLLFYRLLCRYDWLDNNVNDRPPITSVWQVKLRPIPRDFPFYDPRGVNPSVIFMDDRGLFDIRAEGVEEMVDDLVDLVNDIFSDERLHPNDGDVTGCMLNFKDRIMYIGEE